MIPLKYATASQEIPLGYFVDSTDGNTEETALTIANTDIKLWKSGGTTLANKNSGGATHISNGIYYATLDATDTDTYGPLVIFVHVSGALTVRLECIVMEADAYDALYAAAGTGHIEADVVQISSDATAANNLEADYDGTGFNKSNSTVGTVSTLTGHTAQTGDNYARLGAPAGASISADIAAIEAQTDDIGVAGAGLTAIPWNAAWDAEVESEVTDGLNAYDPPTRAELTTDTNSILAKLLAYVQLLARSDAAIATDNATELTAINADGGSGAGDFANTAEALEALRDRGDAAWPTAVGFSTHNAADVRTEVDANSTQLAAIVADTNELQTDDVPGLIAALNDPTVAAIADAIFDEALAGHVTAGTLGKAIADIETDTNELQTDDVPGLIAALNDPTAAAIAAAILDEALAGHATVGTVGKAITDIEADTNELQSDDVPGLIAALNDLSAAEVNAEVDTALADIHLDHLLAVDYNPAAIPGVATALLNELVESDAGVSRFTANALEQGPGGGGDGSGLTAIPWNSAWDAEVESEVNDALVAIHLDHLLAADYDPASKPGTATALLNELVEDDGGVSRFTTNALENAPSGSSITDWNATERGEIRNALGLTGTAGTAAGGQLQTLDANVDLILADTNELQTDDVPGLIAGLNDLSAAEVNAEVDTALADYDAPTNAELTSGLAGLNDPTAAAIADAVLDEALAGHVTAGTLGKAVADIEADTNELQGDDVPGLISALNDPTAAAIRTEIDSNSTQLAAIVADTNELQTDLADGGRLDLLIDSIITNIAALNDVSAAEVNAEMLDVLNVDTFTELTGVPADDATITQMVRWLYLLARNKITQTSATQTIYADDGSTSVATASITDDATTFTRNEYA